jgi:uncharacterized membrane protein (DUF2068 family)
MRPLGVSAIAVLTWVRGALYALGGLALIGIGHLSARLISAIATDTFLENLISRLGKALGVGALLVAVLYIVVGFGLWELKNWARMLTLVFVGLWFVVGLLGLVRHPTSWHMVRAVVDVVIIAYLMLPNVKRLFATA